MDTKKYNIALVGNPNSGKTSLFNLLTGLNQKVGNFPGVTVDKKTGLFKLNEYETVTIIDLPGSYSLYPRREDEWVSYKVLMSQDKTIIADAIVIVADASSLKRNLLYVSQLIDLKIPAILTLTMLDVARKKNIQIDLKGLERELGIPVLAINPRKNKGVQALIKLIEATKKKEYQPPAYDFIKNKELANNAVISIKKIFPNISNYSAIHHLINYNNFNLSADIKEKIKKVEVENNLQQTRIQAEEIMQRYKRIKQIIQATITEESIIKKQLVAEKLDKVVLHKTWGYIILISVLLLLFQSIFWLAQYPMEIIETIFLKVSTWMTSWMPENKFSKFIIDGIIGGIGGIVAFVPQIMILFGLTSILEETGYMARIGFLTDKIMRKVGLNGKSVMPMISGFACAVPAIMSVRNIENKKERLLTILIIPLMSCSARLPVYTILIALVIPNKTIFGFLSLQGLVMMGLYIFSVTIAMMVAYIAKSFIKIKEKSYFILELPLYRHPRYKNVLITMIEKAKLFVFDAGKIIMIISLLLWLLTNYGPIKKFEKIEEYYNNEVKINPQNEKQIEIEKRTAMLEGSYAGIIGKGIEPIIKPLGFDWKIGIALITSFAAREVFVGTMANLYAVDTNKDQEHTLRQKMEIAIDSKGQKVYTIATGVSLMLFYLLAMQCMSTLAIVKRETNSWKWPIIQFTYMTFLAYIISFLAYQFLK